MIVEVKNLVAGYGHRPLIRNLSFSVPTPAFVAIVGHNGAGKTTLFKAFQHKIDYTGEILVQQQDLRSIRHAASSGLLSYLPQKNIVSFSIKVIDLVVMGLFRKKSFFDNYNSEDYARAAATLAQLEMAHLQEQDFTTLSGGEQQMVWLAQLMLQDATIILLDEPTQQLDVYYKKRVFNLLQQWVQVQSKTVFCITHDLHNLLSLQGFLLNLSKPNPVLEPISPETVQQNQDFLEAGRPRL
ncbi:ABC transporter ATP-binding protein [Pontibacter sp. JH31]|uniref:ABC transporter ATP-binding protein n=1 Tax=Pontibacter aquaedesilientis TaxID=2766980 RepID=A0ABR7XNB4_9BACT|nr:ABC transporter ATP-binding protein [Pontibacter aquaedesilientis]MBD1398906.1 ABC transporter ATP-binding protein [Pontibacter aquaedesilientis]